MINVAGEIKNSNTNGPGLRYVLFVQGCPHHCNGCQNEHTWSFKENRLMSIDEIFKLIANEIPIIKGVTFSGGEPFEQASELSMLAKHCKEIGLNIMIYTGYTYEQLQLKSILKESGIYQLLYYTDILIDGNFDKNKTNNPGIYRGSSNQRMIYLNKGKIIKIK